MPIWMRLMPLDRDNVQRIKGSINMRKYDDLLKQLDDDQVYSAGLILRFAQQINYAHNRQDLLRIRIGLNSRAMKMGFASLGDGWVRLEGQGLTPGWFGWRWKTLIMGDNLKEEQASSRGSDLRPE